MAESTGLKTKFYMDSSGGTTEVARVAGVGPPQPTREVIEVDELNPVNDIKNKLLGLIDMGEAKLTLNYDPSAHNVIESAFYSGTLQKCKITFPQGVSKSFSAYVTSFAPQDITSSGVMQCEITLTVTTKVI